jgi:hypothetical protein
MATSMPRLTARIIFHKDALDEVLVTDGQGNLLVERPIPEHVTGVDAWDRGLFNAGYRRMSDWRSSPSGFKCRVEPR